MKKLLYITLSIICLSVIYLFVVKTTPQTAVQTHPSAENISSAEDCVCNYECICQENELDCDCSKTKTRCTCTQKNGEKIVIESIEKNNENIEENNPEQTSSEDETLL